jgi:Beta-propeller repeat
MMARPVLLLTISAALALLPPAVSIDAAPRSIGLIAELRGASAKAIAMDSAGNFYVTGSAGSRFHAGPGSTATRCEQNAFVAKFDKSGRLAFAICFGGGTNDAGYAIAVDREGASYVAGQTWSTNFPQNSQLSLPPRTYAQTSFLTKWSANGELLYSTTLGGQGARAVAVGPDGDMYVAGFSIDNSVPMVNAIQPVHQGGSGNDAYIVRIHKDGRRVVYSTYLGGSGSDAAMAIALTERGAVIAGDTSSPDFPTVRAIPRDRPSSGQDAFLAMISNDGAVLEFSTKIGGARDDRGLAVSVADDVIYLAGATQSADFGVTDDALDAGCGSDGTCNEAIGSVRGFPTVGHTVDTFLVATDLSGRLRFSSFIGGRGNDEARGIGVDAAGRLLISTFSTSPEIAPINSECAATACPAVIYEIARSNLSLISETRLPSETYYTPFFEYLPLAASNQSAVIAANRSGGISIFRF